MADDLAPLREQIDADMTAWVEIPRTTASALLDLVEAERVLHGPRKLGRVHGYTPPELEARIALRCKCGVLDCPVRAVLLGLEGAD